jgi:nitrogen fixation protein FixH
MKANFNPWPYGIMAFFVILICCMVSENYYEQELKFQEQIDGTARAQKAGARIQLNAADGKLLVVVPPAQLAQQLTGAIQFYRPSSPALDRHYVLSPAADGRQAVDVSHLTAGPWQVRVKWNAGGQTYFLEEKIVL